MKTATFVLVGALTSRRLRHYRIDGVNSGKGDLALWASLDTLSVSISAYAKSGRMSVADANIAATDLPKITAAITAADAAYNSGNAATASQNVTTATALLAELATIAAKGD